MPVSSFSGLFSTSVYFGALFLLMMVLMLPGLNLYRDAGQTAARALATGVADQVDAMSPGITTDIEFGQFPATSAQVTFSGTTVSASVDGFTSNVRVVWPLSDSRLIPGHHYELTMQGGVVSVS